MKDLNRGYVTGKRLFSNKTKKVKGLSDGQKNVTSTLDHIKGRGPLAQRPS